MEFVRTLPVRKVNGVGRVFERELEAVGIKTCGDIYVLRGYIVQVCLPIKKVRLDRHMFGANFIYITALW